MEQSGSGELSTLQDSSKEELDTVLESISKNPSERIMSCEFDNVSQLLLQWTKDQKWADNPKLYTILHIINRTDLFPKLLDAHITDFWIPFSKLIVKRLVEEQDRKPLLDAQHRCLDEDYPPITGVLHFSYEDSEASELHEVGKLGEGGYGEVHHVQDPRTGKAYARKTMPRPGNFQRQCDLMRNFKKEVIGMRRVRHRHCVELVASFTDAGSVVLLCSPVADMDLAAYLDLDLDKGGLDILRNAVGCITSALAYLHAENIRHGDFKPNNILIHGSNILLTDFGFCLDFSDNACSTTAGPPTHFSRRYSAPEVFGREPRNTLTDVWGLGCVLFEILSRLRGHKLKSLQDFWHMNGIRYNSFAENQEATASWIKMLTHTPTRAQHGTDRKELWLISFVYQSLLGQDRLLRPTAKQVLDKLQDLDLIYPVQNSLGWVAECCSTRPSLSTSSSPFRGSIPQWPILDPLFLDDHLAYLFLDANLEVFAHSKNPTIADGIRDSVSRNLESIVAPEHDRNEIGRAARLMLSSRSLQSRHDLKPLAFHDRISTSMLTGALEEVSFMVVFLNLFIAGKDGIPEMRTVQLSLHTICMERQEDFGRPFFVMVFDPEQWDIRYDVNAPAKTVSLHVHIDTKDLWTDGLPLSASLPNEYTACKSTVSTRQLAVRERLEEIQVFKCTYCKKYGLECERLMTGVCNICREKSARCIVSPFDFHHAGAKLRIALMNESKEEASRLAAQHVKMEIALQLQFQSGILTDMDKWVHYL